MSTIGTSCMPPVGWADVATQRDLDVLEHRIRADMRAEVHAALTSQTRTLMFTVLGSNVTMATLAFAAAGFG